MVLVTVVTISATPAAIEPKPVVSAENENEGLVDKDTELDTAEQFYGGYGHRGYHRHHYGGFGGYGYRPYYGRGYGYGGFGGYGYRPYGGYYGS